MTDRVRDENINGDSPLAAGVAAVVVAAAAVPVVVIAAAAAAGDQQDQDDDPPAVVAAKHIVTTHNHYLRILLSDSPLIPCYSAALKMCGSRGGNWNFGHCIIPSAVVICPHYTNKRRKCQ